MTVNLAMIVNDTTLVINTIVANDADFTMEGYYFIQILEGVFCQPGVYYNKADGLFYVDDDFSVIADIKTPNSSV